jgi:hypothetical protein
VIIQALWDIGMIGPPSTGRYGRRPKNLKEPEPKSALLWLTRDQKDFFHVCDLAGVEPMLIRGQVNKYLGMTRTVGTL